MDCMEFSDLAQGGGDTRSPRRRWSNYQSLISRQVSQLQLRVITSGLMSPAGLSPFLETSCLPARSLQTNSNALQIDPRPLSGLPFIAKSVCPLLRMMMMIVREVQSLNCCRGAAEMLKRLKTIRRTIGDMCSQAKQLENQLRQYIDPAIVSELRRRELNAERKAEELSNLIGKLRRRSRRSASDPRYKKVACDLSRETKEMSHRLKCEWQCVGRLKEILLMARDMDSVLQLVVDLSGLLKMCCESSQRRLLDKPPPYELCSNPERDSLLDSSETPDSSQPLGRHCWERDSLLDSFEPLDNLLRLDNGLSSSRSEVTLSMSLDFTSEQRSRCSSDTSSPTKTPSYRQRSSNCRLYSDTSPPCRKEQIARGTQTKPLVSSAKEACKSSDRRRDSLRTKQSSHGRSRSSSSVTSIQLSIVGPSSRCVRQQEDSSCRGKLHSQAGTSRERQDTRAGNSSREHPHSKGDNYFKEPQRSKKDNVSRERQHCKGDTYFSEPQRSKKDRASRERQYSKGDSYFEEPQRVKIDHSSRERQHSKVDNYSQDRRHSEDDSVAREHHNFNRYPEETGPNPHRFQEHANVGEDSPQADMPESASSSPAQADRMSDFQQSTPRSELISSPLSPRISPKQKIEAIESKNQANMQRSFASQKPRGHLDSDYKESTIQLSADQSRRQGLIRSSPAPITQMLSKDLMDRDVLSVTSPRIDRMSQAHLNRRSSNFGQTRDDLNNVLDRPGLDFATRNNPETRNNRNIACGQLKSDQVRGNQSFDHARRTSIGGENTTLALEDLESTRVYKRDLGSCPRGIKCQSKMTQSSRQQLDSQVNPPEDRPCGDKSSELTKCREYLRSFTFSIGEPDHSAKIDSSQQRTSPAAKLSKAAATSQAIMSSMTPQGSRQSLQNLEALRKSLQSELHTPTSRRSLSESRKPSVTGGAFEIVKGDSDREKYSRELQKQIAQECADIVRQRISVYTSPPYTDNRSIKSQPELSTSASPPRASEESEVKDVQNKEMRSPSESRMYGSSTGPSEGATGHATRIESKVLSDISESQELVTASLERSSGVRPLTESETPLSDLVQAVSTNENRANSRRISRRYHTQQKGHIVGHDRCYNSRPSYGRNQTFSSKKCYKRPSNYRTNTSDSQEPLLASSRDNSEFGCEAISSSACQRRTTGRHPQMQRLIRSYIEEDSLSYSGSETELQCLDTFSTDSCELDSGRLSRSRTRSSYKSDDSRCRPSSRSRTYSVDNTEGDIEQEIDFDLEERKYLKNGHQRLYCDDTERESRSRRSPNRRYDLDLTIAEETYSEEEPPLEQDRERRRSSTRPSKSATQHSKRSASADSRRTSSILEPVHRGSVKDDRRGSKPFSPARGSNRPSRHEPDYYRKTSREPPPEDSNDPRSLPRPLPSLERMPPGDKPSYHTTDPREVGQKYEASLQSRLTGSQTSEFFEEAEQMYRRQSSVPALDPPVHSSSVREDSYTQAASQAHSQPSGSLMYTELSADTYRTQSLLQDRSSPSGPSQVPTQQLQASELALLEKISEHLLSRQVSPGTLVSTRHPLSTRSTPHGTQTPVMKLSAVSEHPSAYPSPTHEKFSQILTELSARMSSAAPFEPEHASATHMPASRPSQPVSQHPSSLSAKDLLMMQTEMAKESASRLGEPSQAYTPSLSASRQSHQPQSLHVDPSMAARISETASFQRVPSAISGMGQHVSPVINQPQSPPTLLTEPHYRTQQGDLPQRSLLTATAEEAPPASLLGMAATPQMSLHTVQQTPTQQERLSVVSSQQMTAYDRRSNLPPQMTARDASLIHSNEAWAPDASLIPPRPTLDKERNVVPAQPLTAQSVSSIPPQQMTAQEGNLIPESSSIPYQRMTEQESSSIPYQQMTDQSKSLIPSQQMTAPGGSLIPSQQMTAQSVSLIPSQQETAPGGSLIPSQQMTTRKPSSVPSHQTSFNGRSLVPSHYSSGKEASLIHSQQMTAQEGSLIPSQHEASQSASVTFSQRAAAKETSSTLQPTVGLEGSFNTLQQLKADEDEQEASQGTLPEPSVGLSHSSLPEKSQSGFQTSVGMRESTFSDFGRTVSKASKSSLEQPGRPKKLSSATTQTSPKTNASDIGSRQTDGKRSYHAESPPRSKVKSEASSRPSSFRSALSDQRSVAESSDHYQTASDESHHYLEPVPEENESQTRLKSFYAGGADDLEGSNNTHPAFVHSNNSPQNQITSRVVDDRRASGDMSEQRRGRRDSLGSVAGWMPWWCWLILGLLLLATLSYLACNMINGADCVQCRMLLPNILFHLMTWGIRSIRLEHFCPRPT